jgi:hypothetical protein
MQRRWRVRSIIRLRDAAHAHGADQTTLGILAGRLDRLQLSRRSTSIRLDGPAWALVVRGRAAVIADDTTVLETREARRLDPGDELRQAARRCTIILLPGDMHVGLG